jgi:hypothetical protein
MSTRKQGERNSKLSNTLFTENITFENKKFYDWVVTISFYAAIHYLEDFILPKTINSQNCINLNEVKSAYKMPGRHEARERLVWDNMSTDIAAYYSWLDNKSRFARYTTFKVTITEAEKAQDYLNKIINACTPPPTSKAVSQPIT